MATAPIIRAEETEVPPSGTAHQPLLQAGVNTLVTNLVQVALSVFIAVSLSRKLGPGSKGVYDLCIASVTLAVSVIGFSLPSGITFAVASGRASSKKLVSLSALIALGQTALLLCVLWFLPERMSASVFPISAGLWVIPWVIALFYVESARSYWRALLIGRMHYLQANYADLSKAVVLAGCVAVILFSKAIGNITATKLAIAATVAGAAVSGVVALKWINTREEDPPKRANLGTILRISLPSWLANMVQTTNYRFGLFAVNAAIGLSGAGLYQSGATIVQLLNLIPAAAAAILYPLTAKMSSENRDPARGTACVARFVFWASAAISAVLAAIAPFMVRILFGSAFLPSIPVIWALLPGNTIFTIATVIAAFIAGRGRPELNLIGSVVGLLVCAPLTVWLAKDFGLIGAAWGSTFGLLANVICLIIFFARDTKLGPQVLVFPQPGDGALLAKAGRDILVSIRNCGRPRASTSAW
jgi:O-antigen/teichoic acid export membrane protein